MRKQLLTWALAATCVLALSTSCNNLPKVKIEGNTEEITDEEGHQPRYLRDSDEWGPVVQHQLALEEFERVRTAGQVDIFFQQGDEFNVVAEGNEQVIPLYDFSVADGELIVIAKKEHARNSPFMRLIVTAPTLTEINTTGVGDVCFREPVEFFNDLNIHINGTGDLEVDSMLCDAFNAEISGAGDIEVHRLQCLSAQITMSGTGDTQIKRISCMEDATFTITGSAEIEAKVKCQNLNVLIDGDGQADIKCECEKVDARAEGTGSIELEGETRDIVTNKNGLATISTKLLRIIQ